MASFHPFPCLSGFHRDFVYIRRNGTWRFTGLLFKSINQKILDMMMGFAAGVMIAASFWSLLSPAIDLLAQAGDNAAYPGRRLSVRQLLYYRHGYCYQTVSAKEGEQPKRSVLLTTAVTMHNIPKGGGRGCIRMRCKQRRRRDAVQRRNAGNRHRSKISPRTCVSIPLRRKASRG